MSSQTPNLTIRRLERSEAPLYRVLRIKSLATDQAAFHLDLETAKAKPDSFFWDEISDPQFGCFGAFVEGQIVGMLTVKRTSPSSASLYTLYVVPEFRSKGIAGALLRAAILVAKDVGITQLSFTVMENNPAIALYEAFGFKKEGNVSGSLNEFIYKGAAADLKVI